MAADADDGFGLAWSLVHGSFGLSQKSAGAGLLCNRLGYALDTFTDSLDGIARTVSDISPDIFSGVSDVTASFLHLGTTRERNKYCHESDMGECEF
jgi:hypothetical protein